MTLELFGSVDNYINAMFAPHDDALAAAERAIVESGIPQISVSPNQGKFLHVLAKMCGARKILEVGTLGGYSTIWMARALPPGGKVVTLEIDPKHAEVARANFERAGLSNVIDIRLGKAVDSLPALKAASEGPFDMIFIDADKPPYAEYFQLALKLSKPGTLIVADNVIRAGKVLDAQTDDEMVSGVQRFNKVLSQTPGVTATIIQNIGAKEHDGMALIVVN
ncbi:MAG TPA: O-methyltransferase [Cyclobacteriaceae bacterium]|nr:O-methyltransferase [Cyclobacteriaceae bacterium]